jgi:hypothetical protein
MLECEACGARWMSRDAYMDELIDDLRLDDLIPDADGTCPRCGGDVYTRGNDAERTNGND